MLRIDAQQDCSKILATVNLLLGKSLGKIHGRIAPRFWLPGILLPSESLAGTLILLGFLPGINILAAKISPSGIPPRIWSLFYKGM